MDEIILSINSKANNIEYSVSELSNLLKKTVEDNFSLVRIRGEISGAKLAPSGHLYFSLKDENALIASACWKGMLSKIQVKPEDGMEVIVTGSITTYPGQSKYQLIVHNIEVSGIGALMLLLERRKKQFEAEGLFLVSRKKKIPFLSSIIGIITSPTGAVIKDMLHRIKDRFPSRVILWPVLVQGNQSAEQVANAVLGFNNFTQDRPDVIIIARGGGSFEDLFSFNEEKIIRAVALSNIPIVSAIGHETDFTLIDFVSDLRAPTPTAAAEMCVPVKEELALKIAQINSSINLSIYNLVDLLNLKIVSLFSKIIDPEQKFYYLTQRFDDLVIRFSLALPSLFMEKQRKFYKAISNLHYPSNRVELYKKRMVDFDNKIKSLMMDIFQLKLILLMNTSSRIVFEKLENNLNNQAQQIQHLFFRLTAKTNYIIHDQQKNIVNLGKMLNNLSYHNILKRGFVVVRDSDNKVIKYASKLKSPGEYQLEFSDKKITRKIMEE